MPSSQATPQPTNRDASSVVADGRTAEDSNTNTNYGGI